jgi:hypothetical protein
MLGSFNPVQALPVTVVTPQLIIVGTIQTRLRSLTDVMNEPDVEHLILFDATFMEVGSRRVIAAAAVAQVQLADMLFVHSTGSTESGPEQRTPKQAIRATLLVSPFTVEGQIHLPNEVQLNQALDALSGRFVPVTGARYWAYGVAESPNYVDLLVLNHARAHVAIEVGVEWHPDTEAGEPPRGGSNPW